MHYVTLVAQNSGSSKIFNQYIKEIKTLKNDTNKVLSYLKFAGLLRESPDTALILIKKAKKLSTKLNYSRGVERAICVEGYNAIDNDKNYTLGIHHLGEAMEIATAYQLYDDLYNIYNASLNIYYYQADYPNAMNIAQKGLSLAEKLNDKENQAHYDNQIGFIYQKQENPGESMKYYGQCLKLSGEIHNRMMGADAYNGIGDGYLLEKNYKTALFYFFKALHIYLKIKEYPNGDESERLGTTRVAVKHERVAYTFFKISMAFKLAGDYKSALQYSLQIFEISYKRAKKGWTSFNNYDLSNYYTNIGDIYRLLKDYEKAILFLHKGLFLARSIHHQEDIRDAYDALSKTYAATHRYDSAYYYHLLYTGIKDSIFNEKISREISTLEVGRKEKEITLLNQQQKLKEAELSRQAIKRNFIFGFAALIAVVSFLLLYVRNKIRRQKLVYEKQLALEAERQRISSDMHDDVGSGLSTMLIYINMLKMKLARSGDEANINRISALGAGLVDQMKEIIWSLSPSNDRLDSLLLYMRQYFLLLFDPLPHNVNIDYPETIPEVILGGDVRRNIFLCVKESLNNVIKHAGASCVELQAKISDHALIVEIKDNGRGFVPGETSGNGLKNMLLRMNDIRGKFDIKNENGTVVTLELDLPPYPNG